MTDPASLSSDYDSKAYTVQLTAPVAAADMSLVPDAGAYVTKVTACQAPIKKHIAALAFETTDATTGAATAVKGYGDVSTGNCVTVNVGPYDCFNKVVVYASGTNWLGAMKFTDTAGGTKYVGFNDANEAVSRTPFDMGATGCLSGYDIWINPTSLDSIDTAVLFSTVNAKRYPKLACSGAAAAGAKTEHPFDLPEKTAVAGNSLYAAGTDYFTITSNVPAKTAAECVPTYALKTADPDVTVDAATGGITYNLKPGAKGDKTVTVEVDIANKQQGTSEKKEFTFTIKGNCAASSTTITPEFATIAEFKQYQDDETAITTTVQNWDVSNAACPVTSMAIKAGAAQFKSAGYVVTMDTTAQTVVGDFPWTATLTAEGGATVDVTQSIKIKPACRSKQKASFKTTQEFKLPLTGTTGTGTLATAGTEIVEYSSNDATECTTEFAWSYQNGTAVDTTYTLDKATGKFTMLLDSNRPIVSDTLKVTVVTKGSAKDDTIEVQNIKVDVVCGPGSTVVTPADPIIDGAWQYADDSTVVTHTVSGFVSSNIHCPIQSIALRTADATDFDLTGYTVTMKTASQAIAGDYSWQATLTAKGGAIGTTL